MAKDPLSDCNFVVYVMKGQGRIFAGEEIFDVEPEDVVFVPARSKFAAEGEFVYITFDSPTFYVEQSTEIRV
jgi:mannose-6-phosphate isomerase-like protein (cupin superfamily)